MKKLFLMTILFYSIFSPILLGAEKVTERIIEEKVTLEEKKLLTQIRKKSFSIKRILFFIRLREGEIKPFMIEKEKRPVVLKQEDSDEEYDEWDFLECAFCL